MERITRQVLNLIKEKKQKKFIKILNKNKKEVNINGFGTHKYMIKEGVNKGKIL
jgi:hypothetical protein|tara:strand:- start:347 stop:508 length:162 start_codon:yes stop_codon:yes gene_type:complete